MADTKKFNVFNDTNEVLGVIDVGRFVPGDNEIELDETQVELMKHNNVLTLKEVVAGTKPVAAKEAPVKDITE